MTSQMKKKPVKKVSSVKKSDNSHVDEGIFDFLRGGGMTPEQTKEYNYFIQNFIGNITGQVNRAIQSKLIDVKLTEYKSKTKSKLKESTKFERLNAIFESILMEAVSITQYLTDTVFPSYLKNVQFSPEEKTHFYELVKEVGNPKIWNSASNRTTYLKQMGGLIYNALQMKRNAASQQAQTTQTTQTTQPQQAQQPGQPRAGRQPSYVQQLKTSLGTSWNTLNSKQKQAIKNFVAGLS